MAIERQPSCDDVVETGLLPVEVARARLVERIAPVLQTETVALRQALRRVIAVALRSPMKVPGYTNSAMDGYAINSADIPTAGERTLEVIGTAWAGRPLDVEVSSGQAVRIMTGGMMPMGTDTVVIQEHVRIEGQCIGIDAEVMTGRNVRHAGEDIDLDEIVIAAGTRLDPAHIGLMASLGIDRVEVYRRPVVAYCSTGDELRALDIHAGTTLEPGGLFDSNRYTLGAMLQRLDVETLDMGLIADDREATREAFCSAAERADLLISSGGVSAGAADFVSDTLAQVGEVAFWKIAMRPGRPLAFGHIGDAHFFGLPGNPVAVMVTFYEFVQPAILRLMGCETTESMLFPAICQSRLRKSLGRVEYQRGVLRASDDGQLGVSTTGKQGAGRLSSMCMANCLIVLPPECDGVEPGDTVQVRPFHALV